MTTIADQTPSPAPRWLISRRRHVFAAVAVGIATTALCISPADAQRGLNQRVSSSERFVTDQQVVLASGHVDIGPKIVDGKWVLALRDDTVQPSVWRPLDRVVLWVKDSAQLDVPNDPAYNFIARPANGRVWVVPQVQSPNVVWIGWNTQDPAALERMGNGASLSLEGHAGPSPMSLFLQEGLAGGAPKVLWNSVAGQNAPVWMERNTHVHANWVFGAPGTHRLTLRTTAQRDANLTAAGVLNVVVGNGTDPRSAFPAAGSGAGTSVGAPANAAVPQANQPGGGQIGAGQPGGGPAQAVPGVQPPGPAGSPPTTPVQPAPVDTAAQAASSPAPSSAVATTATAVDPASASRGVSGRQLGLFGALAGVALAIGGVGLFVWLRHRKDRREAELALLGRQR